MDKEYREGLAVDLERMFGIVLVERASPFIQVESREISGILADALRQLNPVDSGIVVGYYFHGKKYREIKERLGLSMTISNIALRRNAALHKLKEILWQKYTKSDLL